MGWMQFVAMLMPAIGALALCAFGLYISRNDGKRPGDKAGPAE